jgi:peptide deformylase
MTVLPIIIHPDPLLRQPTHPVAEFNESLSNLIQDMFDTMKEKKGVGLAAPQIGILRKIIVVSYKKRQFALLNPEIVKSSGNEPGEEGCLSIPKVHVMVTRATYIEVIATTVRGKSIKLKERGFVARIIQHEIDHLNGTLIIDKGPPLPEEEDNF